MHTMNDLFYMKTKMVRRLLNKGIVKNGAWLYALQLCNTIIPMLTLPYITRVLLPEEYGIFSLALNYVGYIVVLVEYGFNMVGTRKIVISKNPDDDSRIFTSIVLIRGILCLISCIGVLGFCIIDGFELMSRCVLALMLMVIGAALDQTWFFQGKQDMKYIAIINMVARCLSTVLIFLCIKSKEDLLLYCVLYASVNLLNGLLGTIIVCKDFKLRLVRLSFAEIKTSVVEGWYLFISTFSSKILSALGITIMGWLTTTYDCGIYSAIYKIPSVILLAWNPISQILYPISSEKMALSYQDGSGFVKKMQKLFWGVFAIGCLTLACLSEFTVRLVLGESYAPYHYILYPLLAWILAAIYNNFSGVQMLLAAGYGKEYSKCIRLSAVISVVANLVGIYFFGIMGAACAPLVSEAVLTVLLWRKRKTMLKQ